MTKKIVLLTVLTLLLSSCSGGESTSPNRKTESSYTASPTITPHSSAVSKEIKLTINGKAINDFVSLGMSYNDCKNLLLNNNIAFNEFNDVINIDNDVITVWSFYFEKERLNRILVYDETFVTDKGLRRGDNINQILQLYGDDYEFDTEGGDDVINVYKYPDITIRAWEDVDMVFSFEWSVE